MDVKHRLTLVQNLQDAIRQLKLTDGSPSCISKNNVLVNTFKLVSKIGSGSVNGEAYKICYPIQCNGKTGDCACQSDSVNLAVKRIPIKPRTLSFLNTPYTFNALNDTLWVELLCMKLCNILVENNVVPNLPVYVNYFYCNSCTYENPVLKPKNNSPCIILINELATEGDLSNWTKIPRTPQEWVNAYFQIFVGLYAMQKYFDITHHDLHWNNVLVHKVAPGGYWRYVIDGKTYDVPNLGYLFVLWDFGLAQIPGKMENKEYQFHYDSDKEKPRLLADYFKILKAPMWRENDDKLPIPPPEDVNIFVNMIRSLHKDGASLKEVIKMYQQIYPVQNREVQIIAEFSLDKKVQLPPELQQFSNKGSIPSRTRRPSAEEITIQDKLMNVAKNGFVRQTKEKRRGFALALKRLSEAQSFTERMALAAELEAVNYPPPPVEDISRPEEAVVLGELQLKYLDKIDRGFNGVWPDFMDEVFDNILQSRPKPVSRALWARAIAWASQVNLDSRIIEALKEPISDYYERTELKNRMEQMRLQEEKEQPLIPHPPDTLPPRERRRIRMKPANVSKLPIDLEFVDAIIEELDGIGSEFNEGMLKETQALIMVMNATQRIMKYLNKLDGDANFDTATFSKSTVHKLSAYACLLRVLKEKGATVEDESLDVLEDIEEDRLSKMGQILYAFAPLLQQESGTRLLIDTLKAFYSGEIC